MKYVLDELVLPLVITQDDGTIMYKNKMFDSDIHYFTDIQKKDETDSETDSQYDNEVTDNDDNEVTDNDNEAFITRTTTINLKDVLKINDDHTWQKFQNINFLTNITIHDKNRRVCVIKSLQDRNMIIFLPPQEKESIIHTNDFFAKFNNEIRASLSDIIGILLLLENTHLTNDQSNYVKIIRNSSFSLLKVINDLLEFSNITNNSIILQKNFFLFDTCLDSAINIVLNNKIHVKKHFPEAKSLVHGDMERIKYIIITILQTCISQLQGELNQMIVIKLDILDDIINNNSATPSVFSNPQDTVKIIKCIIKNNGHKVNGNLIHNDITQDMNLHNIGLVLCSRICNLMNGSLVFKSTELENTFVLTLRLRTRLINLQN